MTRPVCQGVVRRHYNLTLPCEQDAGHPGPCRLSGGYSSSERTQAEWEADERKWMEQQGVTRG